MKHKQAPSEKHPAVHPPKGGGDGKGGGGSDPMSGPVVFYPPKNPTAAEIQEVDDYVAGCNRALEANALSPTGRVATTKSSLAKEAQDAAARERKAHPELYSGGKVAGHVPDTGWGRGPEPHEWQAMTRRVNSSLGGQNKRYPVGYKRRYSFAGIGSETCLIRTLARPVERVKAFPGGRGRTTSAGGG